MQDHIKCQTQKNQHHHWINICPSLLRQTPTFEMRTHPRMLVPRAKIVLKNHGALFWINPFVWPRNHTHTKCTTYPNFSDTREKMTTATKTNNRSKKLQNWTRRGFSVPSSRQCAEPETTETREKIHVKRNNSTNGTRQSEKQSENTEQMTITEATKSILTTTLSAIDLHTPHNKRPKQVDSLRCADGDHVHRRSSS